VTAPADVARSTMRKAALRLAPYLCLLYFVAYLDRTNTGFAKLTMNPALGISESAFGLAAGVFFIGYALLEVPSNLIMARVGARRWLARIMVSWGIVAAATAFVVGPVSLTTMRFLLGIAEAGFYPGVLLYLTFWFPRRYRVAVLAAFTVAQPLSNALGAPLSGWLLGVHAFGLQGWQSVFLAEGLPAVVLGVLTWFLLPDRPADARWLTTAERDWLTETLAEEQRDTEAAHGRLPLRRAFTDRRVLVLTGVYFGTVFGAYGLSMWLPTIVKAMAHSSNLGTGVLVMVPYLIAAVALVPLSRLARSTPDVRWFVLGSMALVGVGLVVAVIARGVPAVALGALTVAAVALYSAVAAFWHLPGRFLTGAAAAAGIAFINSIGNLAGFAGPYAVGWIAQASSAVWGLLAIAAVTWVAALGVLAVRDPAEVTEPARTPPAAGGGWRRGAGGGGGWAPAGRRAARSRRPAASRFAVRTRRTR
jgi:MFS transporter, ACS family, tartrate transporter